MTETALDPSTLPLKTPAPDAQVRRFTETLPTTLPPESLWAELTRALLSSRDAVLWANDVSTVSTLRPPLAEGSVLAEQIQPGGAVLHYRLVRFEPPRLLEYASLQSHHLAGGAVVSVEHSAGTTTLRWQGEYRGTEPQLALLDRFRAAFFASLATQLRRLEAAR
ncbi:SRPBCC family protein [Archangium violaceum]|uniref:SRPBCC family protein n=1 Tax=Archangium violaceum TaxID=83451 RepID=UPI00194F0450|nr:SRPBCC family protein [Archangium violaceum]QRN97603.1 SRPBCC family protein [Archangium violaceum]